MKSTIFNFLSTSNSTLSLENVVLNFAAAAIIGLVIFLCYKITHSRAVYSAKFNVSLLMMTVITTLVMSVIGNNIALSLGMVGALSIVRFRTAIKEPLDIAFLFWSIAVGIVLAAGLIPLAVFGSIIIGLIIVIFANHKDHSNPYIVVINCDGSESEKNASAYLAKKTKKCITKSKTAQKGNVEVNYEIRLSDDNTDFINELADMDGINSAVLVSYNGEYMG